MLARTLESPDDALVRAGGLCLGVLPNRAQRDHLGRGHHVHRDDGLARVLGEPHGVVRRPDRGHGGNAAAHGPVPGIEPVEARADLVIDPDVAPGPDVQRHRQPGEPVRTKPVEEACAVQPARCPPCDGATGWQTQRLLEDALLGEVRAGVRRHVEAGRGTPPVGTGCLPPCRADGTGGIHPNRTDEESRMWRLRVPAMSHRPSVPQAADLCERPSTGPARTFSTLPAARRVRRVRNALSAGLTVPSRQMVHD